VKSEGLNDFETMSEVTEGPPLVHARCAVEPASETSNFEVTRPVASRLLKHLYHHHTAEAARCPA
jgi:hypothetical protein